MLGLLALWLLLLLGVQPATAQETLSITSTGVTSNFPQDVTFNLTARGPADITDAEVRFRVERRSCARVEDSRVANWSSGSKGGF